jgi:outer membrane lipoprotein-sorting protein
LRAATPGEVLAAYDAYCESGTTLSASGHLDVRDRRTGKGRTLGVRLVAARGGRLYLKGSVAVITALEVVADGERFWFQVPSKKTVWTGAGAGEAREAGTDDAPYQAMRPSDVTSALLPEPLAPGPGETVLLDGDRDAFTLTVAAPAEGRGLARRRVSLDRDTLRPVRLRRYDARGDIETDVTLSLWTEGQPHQVEIRRPVQGYEAAFRFDKVERNVPVPERAFAPRIPEGYSVVEVR